jgi:hypothetical protein
MRRKNMAASKATKQNALPGYKPSGKPQTADASTAKPTNNPTAKQAKILATVTTKPGLTTREVAAICETDHSYVVQVMQRYGITNNNVHDYKANRADILAGMQHRLLASITDGDIQKSPLGSRVLAAAQLYDKERLERGQSTDNVNVLVAGLKEMQAARWGRKVDKPVDNSSCQPKDDPTES